MRIGAVSGDLLVKLAVGVAVAGGALYLLNRARLAALPVVDAINPASPDNLAYRGVNAVGGSVFVGDTAPGKNADGSWTLGGWVYDVLHGDQVGMMLTGKPKF